MTDTTITVGYWSIRGLGAPLRMMVMFANAKLNAEVFDVTEKGEHEWDTAAWFSVKPALKEKNPLMNLPYVICDDKVVAQTNACFLFIGRKLNLLGDNEDELSACEQLLCELMDLRDVMVKFAYSPTSNVEKASQVLTSVASAYGSLHKLELWLESEKRAGKSGNFLVGDRASAPDFHLWEMLDQFQIMSSTYSLPSALDAFPALSAFHQSFRAIPQNARYFASPLAALPLNNKMAAFGSAADGSQWVRGQASPFGSLSGAY